MSGKHVGSGKRSLGSKSVCLMIVLVLTLVIGCTIGGTLAWLTASSGPVENTFVAGQIGSLTLTEDADQIATTDGHQFIVIPGVDITKDPKVTYTPTTVDGTVPVDAYVFVQLTQTNAGTDRWTWNAVKEQYEIKNTSGTVVMSFAIDSTWEKLDVDGQEVFYKAVAKTDNGLSDVSIIAGNTIDVSDEITEDDVVTVAKAADGLTFTAYAIQQDGFTDAADAWDEVSGANK